MYDQGCHERWQPLVIRIGDILTRFTRSLAVYTAVYTLPSGKLDVYEVIAIGLVAGTVLTLRPVVSPSIATGARLGSGLAFGANIAGGFPTGAPRT